MALTIVIYDSNRYFSEGLKFALELSVIRHMADIAQSYQAHAIFINEDLMGNHTIKPKENQYIIKITNKSDIMVSKNDEIIFRKSSIPDLLKKIESILNKIYQKPTLREFVGNKISLSSREYEIAKYIAKGFKLTVIGRLLNINIKTVSTHKRNLMKKLKLKKTLELYQWILNGGLNHVNIKSPYTPPL